MRKIDVAAIEKAWRGGEHPVGTGTGVEIAHPGSSCMQTHPPWSTA